MGRRDYKKRDVQLEPAKWSNEIIGGVLVLVSLVLLLSLVSYSPADLPRWGLLEPFADKSGKSGNNFIGWVGGVLGFSQILLFGAAAYLIPVACSWFGMVKLAFDGELWPRSVLGVVMLAVAADPWDTVISIDGTPAPVSVTLPLRPDPVLASAWIRIEALPLALAGETWSQVYWAVAVQATFEEMAIEPEPPSVGSARVVVPAFM